MTGAVNLFSTLLFLLPSLLEAQFTPLCEFFRGACKDARSHEMGGKSGRQSTDASGDGQVCEFCKISPFLQLFLQIPASKTNR
jgi:hypothetical protein